jgi:hypothetical protein
VIANSENLECGGRVRRVGSDGRFDQAIPAIKISRGFTRITQIRTKKSLKAQGGYSSNLRSVFHPRKSAANLIESNSSGTGLLVMFSVDSWLVLAITGNIRTTKPQICFVLFRGGSN